MQLELSIEIRDTGEVSVQRLPLEDRIVLGRGPESPVALDGPLISREHIAFERFNGKLSVTDLSSNGSWINGEQVTPGRRYLLSDGDRVQVPGYEMIPTLLPSPEEKTAPAAAAAAPPPPPAALVKQSLASITGMEMVVLMVFGLAVTLTVVFLKL